MKQKGKHGEQEQKFRDLTYSGQAKSINGQILVLSKALKVHLNKAKDENRNVAEAKSILINQLNELISSL